MVYTRWNDPKNGNPLKSDLDFTIAHEFTHTLNIGDQSDDEDTLFGSKNTIMKYRDGRVTYGVLALIIKAFETNEGQGW